MKARQAERKQQSSSRYHDYHATPRTKPAYIVDLLNALKKFDIYKSLKAMLQISIKVAFSGLIRIYSIFYFFFEIILECLGPKRKGLPPFLFAIIPRHQKSKLHTFQRVKKISQSSWNFLQTISSIRKINKRMNQSGSTIFRELPEAKLPTSRIFYLL